ncbi:hypothetical protein GO495_02205 [Chitinophaga oryziterrae]|uniref:Phage abortive infection protein n=2 Tax=Chitinophaga oryziterrae TaxID=1031224 RepID=A0A6N8J538_9BACT|nr:hypothetical protein [Chitinophaga oryziterrae]
MKYFLIYIVILVPSFASSQQVPVGATRDQSHYLLIHADSIKLALNKIAPGKINLKARAEEVMLSSRDSTRRIRRKETDYKESILFTDWLPLISLLVGIVLTLVVGGIRAWLATKNAGQKMTSRLEDPKAVELAEDLFYENRRRTRNIWHAIIFIVLGMLIIGASIWIMEAPDRMLRMGDDYYNKFSKTGVIGDTYGGLIGPWIALIAAILTFLAFMVQYRANLLQREQFEASFRAQARQFNQTMSEQRDASKKQKKQANRERFESRFFELLRLHKENVNEMDLRNQLTKGRRCFFSMFAELKMIYAIIEEAKIKTEQETGVTLKNVNLLNIAYPAFYYGLANEASYLDDFNTEEEAFYKNAVSIRLGLFQSGYSVAQGIPEFDEWYREQDFEPCGGHSDKLGHYYRHLFQTAEYIRDTSLIGEKEKFNYLKTLRAQLSDHEQLMLFYNGTTWFEEEWSQLFTQYRFIKNVPLDLATLGKKPTEFYEEAMVNMYKRENGKKMFEQQGNIDNILNKYHQ